MGFIELATVAGASLGLAGIFKENRSRSRAREAGELETFVKPLMKGRLTSDRPSRLRRRRKK